MLPATSQSPTRDRWQSSRMVFTTALMLSGLVAVCWRLHSVQVVQHETWAARAQGMLKQKRILPATRGAIRDANGELLAHDKHLYELWVNTGQLRDVNDVRARYARLLKMNLRELVRTQTPEEIISNYRTHVAGVLMRGLEQGSTPLESNADLQKLLADEKRVEFALLKNLQESDADHWRSLLKENGIIAISLRSIVRRDYPARERLTHVLGYVNEQIRTDQVSSTPELVQTGREGIEAVMNHHLTGRDGFQVIERDRRGRDIPTYRGEIQAPRHGSEVTLTIDMHLQDIMEGVLEEAMAYHRPKRIVAVLVEPHSGSVLAMASRPHFERDTMKGTISNLAISSIYEPGSVFKIVAFTGALDRRLTSLTEPINCDPNLKVLAAVKLKDHVSGSPTTAEALAQSSNRASYLLARRMGEEGFMDYVSRFGFGQKSGIALTGELSGIVHPRRSWDNLTFSRMAIGHAVTTTPLQMAMAMSAIANGGNLMKPRIIKDVRDENGMIVENFAPEVVRRVCTERTAKLMREAMVGVVSAPKGTGSRAAIEDILVAGKTGTSQRRKDNGIGYEAGHYCVSFAGFAPADNPQLCAIIMVDDPQGDPSELMGGKLAAPIFAQLMKQSLQNIAVIRDAGVPKQVLVKGDSQ